MRTLIAYKTRGGATKKYMDWLCKDLACDILTFGQIGRKFDYAKYDNVIVSSGTYMGLMPLNRFLKRNWKKIRNKNVVVVAVGAAPADDPWSQWSYNRISHKIRENIKYFKILGEVPARNKEEQTRAKSNVNRKNLEQIEKYIKGIK